MTLYEAVESGDVSVVKAALATTPDVNVLGPERRTPLIEAAGRGDLEIVQLLLDAGAEPHWRDATDETALLRAAANGHLAVARLLSPHSNDEERALANSFLKAFGATQGPDLPREAPGLKRKVAEVAARAAGFVGYDEPQERIERVDRSATNTKKK